ncbi:MAG: succinylglutamate desuccinylase/aspartoacylase family protein [Thermomicrobiales bacterium]
MATVIDSLDEIALPAPGAKQRGVLRFSNPQLRDWSWPYIVIRGQEDGPRLALISGVHPAEYPSIEANIRLARELDPATLRGTVVSMPVVDVPAFLPRTPFVCPIDNKNPNRFFPGDPNGTFTDAMDDAIFRAVIQPSDYLIDLHGGDMVEALVPFSISVASGNDEVDNAALGLARTFGLPYHIVQRPQGGAIGGTTTHASAAAGIPAIIAEAGGVGQLTEAETVILYDGVENVLRHLGMLAGAPQHKPDPILIERFTWLSSPAEGMWYSAVSVGDHVAAGQVVGRIGNLYGDPLAEITAPRSGDVLFLTTSPAMKDGGLLLAIGER